MISSAGLLALLLLPFALAHPIPIPHEHPEDPAGEAHCSLCLAAAHPNAPLLSLPAFLPEPARNEEGLPAAFSPVARCAQTAHHSPRAPPSF
ncbi:MAG: hypothetical protein FJY73_13165 [Candidatus Eisenbacteria bacterium]|nr:hypothetical protein [Candidatus Eisenbacteria bacterium]